MGRMELTLDRRHLVAAAALAIAAAALMFYSGSADDDDATTASPATPPVPKDAPHGPSPFGSGPGVLEPAPVAPPSQRVLRETDASREFFTTTNLKPFITHARSNPSGASYFYAVLALQECEEFASAPADVDKNATPTMPRPQQAALSMYEQRCRDVTGPDIRQLRRLADEGAAARDAGLAVFTPVAPGTTAQAAAAAGVRERRMIEGLYAARDAGVIWALVRDLAVSGDELSIRGRPMSEVELSSMPAALLLAGCELGVPCDDSHPLVRWECMASGLCDAPDLPSLFRRVDARYWNAYRPASRFDLGVAMRLRDEIVSGVRAGDRAVLVYRTG